MSLTISGATFSSTVYASYFNGTIWSTPEPINENAIDGLINDIGSDIDANGNAMVEWWQPDSQSSGGIVGGIYSKRYKTNMGWQAQQLASATTTSPSKINAVLDKDGNGIAAWATSWSRFTLDTMTNSGSWSNAETLSELFAQLDDRVFRVNSAGKVMMLSNIPVNGFASLRAMVYDPGLGWSSIEDVFNDLGHAHDFAVDSNMNAVAAWVNTVNGQYYIKSALRINGSWGEVKTVRTVPTDYSTQRVSVAFDAANNATIVWDEGKPGSAGAGATDFDGAIFASHYEPVGGWSAQKQISANRGLSIGAHMGSNLNGKLVAAWSIIDVANVTNSQYDWYAVGTIGKDPNLPPGGTGGSGSGGSGSGSGTPKATPSDSGGGITGYYLILALCGLLLGRKKTQRLSLNK